MAHAAQMGVRGVLHPREALGSARAAVELIVREELRGRGLRAMVPMNVRAASEHLELGNRVSSLFVELPVLESDPLVPLAAEHAVGAAAVSYDGNVFFGVVADPDTVPDLEEMLAGMGECARELLAAARSRSA
jgi:hypothetical protein